jgi:aminopeptidase YwaD
MLQLALSLLLMPSVAASAPSVTTAEVLRSHVEYLASPELEGRMTLAPGIERAAEFIAADFQKAGLEPGPNGTFFHEYEVTIGQRPGPGNRLQLGQQTLELRQDFLPLIGSSGTAVRGNLVSVGAGAAEDYQGKSVKGSIAVVDLAKATGGTNGARARTASEHGAVGIIFVYPADRLPVLNRGQGISANLNLAAVGVTQQAWQNAQNAATAEIQTQLEPNRGICRNVIGFLPGNDPELKNEYVIFGAHYDHLGYGEIGSRTGANLIHYGADDNASGTAGVMALARHFAARKDNKRTYIFQLYSGEEAGLLGSNAWARDHPEILKQTTLMINMDMIGRLRNDTLFLFGLSSAQPLEAIVEAADSTGLTLNKAQNVRADSDQASFARRNVPVLVLFTGLHDEYHTERDTPDTLNYAGIVKVLDFAASVARQVDQRPKLEWNPRAVMGNVPGDRAIPPAEQTGQRRIRVGFVPDMAAEGPGARIGGTSPGSPAEKAGFREGDRITEFNGRKVSDLETLNAAMMTAKPGDKVKVVFLRDGREMTLELIVEERTS